jgi:hypothetical protein
MVVAALLCVAWAAPAAPADPTTVPATQPTTQTHATVHAPHLRAWFAELADPDADIRAAAFTRLLGLSRADLEGLREVVEQSRPIAPAQAAALHDIVIHVYLSGEEYEIGAAQGFLGVKSLHQGLEALRLGEVPPGDDGGVAIGERLPGFCGFQSLRDGDMILGVVAPRPMQMTSWFEFQRYVLQSQPGQTITFQVLRQGRITEVPIKLSARPAAAADNFDLGAWQELLADRHNRAEALWTGVFKPLLERDLL